MLTRRLGSPAAIAAAVVLICNTANAREPHAFIELFTSQGCSSCPPADKLLGEFAADPSVVAISVPIDYWDYLGWKDTLASPVDSARQRAYARLRGDRQVYTPQVVVNGAAHALGSDHAAIERTIVQTERDPAIMSVRVNMSLVGDDLRISIGSVTERSSGEVWLCPIAKSVAVAIGRGENGGRTVTYHNVVRKWIKLGDWTGADMSWNVPISGLLATKADAAVVMVQRGTRLKPGVILGAAFLPIGTRTTQTQ
jgi:hypothetical protein